MFITFEGSEGCGKSTQIVKLKQTLQGIGRTVVQTREPGGTPIGGQIRKVLLDNVNTEMEQRTEILLFQASRAQLVEQVIKPSLAVGDIVLCDRYADSTLAYQGYGYQIDIPHLKSIVSFATGDLKPDLTLLLDVDIEEGLRRRSADGDINRLDAYDADFYRRVREGYFTLINEDPDRWVVIDANQPPEVVEQEISNAVFSRLLGKKE